MIDDAIQQCKSVDAKSIEPGDAILVLGWTNGPKKHARRASHNNEIAIVISNIESKKRTQFRITAFMTSTSKLVTWVSYEQSGLRFLLLSRNT